MAESTLQEAATHLSGRGVVHVEEIERSPGGRTLTTHSEMGEGLQAPKQRNSVDEIAAIPWTFPDGTWSVCGKEKAAAAAVDGMK